MRRNVFQEKKEAFIKKAEEKWDRKCQNKIFLLANVIIKIVWCRCVASAAIQLRKLVVRSTKSPLPERSNPLNGENLKYQVRELRRNPPVVMCSARRLSHLWCSSVSGWNRRRGKEYEGCAPSNSAAGEIHLHPGKPVCRF